MLHLLFVGDPTNGIVWSLKRFFDNQVEIAREEREKKAHAEIPRERGGEGPWFQCRVCGLRNQDGEFCPECLADTMLLQAKASPTRE